MRRERISALVRRRISTKESGESLTLRQLGDEWNGMALDFVSNTRVTRVSLGAEALFGSGPIASASEMGIGLDFLDNTYALKV